MQKAKEEKRKRILNRNNTKYLKSDSHFVYADFQQNVTKNKQLEIVWYNCVCREENNKFKQYD